MSPPQSHPPSQIVLFDGDCALCNNTVDFLIRNDRGETLRFAPLQSDTGRRLLEAFDLEAASDRLDSVVFITGNRAYTHSDAALQIARQLDGLWPLLGVFLWVPRGIRDVLYRFVARNRYRWFGKTGACRIPTPELLRRFLP